MGKKLNYGDFTRTGWQDCGNVYDVNEHRDAWESLGRPRDVGAARRVVKEAWGGDDDAYEAWIGQQDVGEMVQDDLDPRKAYRAWRDAWQECAESAVKASMRRWLDLEEDDHATIAAPKARRVSQIQPVEGLRIPPESRRELNRFWRAHPVLRRGCLTKYDFDPINDEEDYWRFGLTEPSHRHLLSAVRKNDNLFSLAHVKRWEAEELKHAQRNGTR